MGSSNSWAIFSSLTLAGISASSGMTHIRSKRRAPSILPDLHSIWTRLGDTPHFSAICLTVNNNYPSILMRRTTCGSISAPAGVICLRMRIRATCTKATSVHCETAGTFADTKFRWNEKCGFGREMGFRSRPNPCKRIPTYLLYSFFRQIARAMWDYFQNRNKWTTAARPWWLFFSGKGVPLECPVGFVCHRI